MTEETLKKEIIIIPHKNSCGKPEMANGKTDVVEICCGDDLGGNNNEFYQCLECRYKDFQEYWKEQGIQSERKRVCEELEELIKYHRKVREMMELAEDEDAEDLVIMVLKELLAKINSEKIAE